MRDIEYLFLNKIEYKEGLRFQRAKVEELKEGSNKSYLIFLEHNDVITIGKRSRRDELLVSEYVLRKEGIEIIETDRGGALTAHGPGQLILYTIFDLKKYNLSVKEFIYRITDSFKIWLKEKGLNVYYDESHPGLYIEGKKLLSLGLRLDNFITYHGFALNLNSIPRGFNYIVPCSMRNCQMTSVYLETHRKYDIKECSMELFDTIKNRLEML